MRHNLKSRKIQLIQQESEECFKNNFSGAFLQHMGCTLETSNEEMDSEIAMKAAVPGIPAIPNSNSSRKDLLAHAIIDDLGKITGKRVVGSEYINSFNDIVLHVVRSNHDVPFILCCAHEIYYTIKYVVKDQNTIDNIAAITITSYTKSLEKESTQKKDMSVGQTVYGRVASMASARSNHIEVGAVTAVHYLLHGTTFACSHEFGSLHLGRHLDGLNEIEGDIGIVPDGGSYIAFNVTSNYKLRPLELESVCLYDYTESFVLCKDIPKNIDSNPDCIRLHPDHPFHTTKVVKRRKIKVVADIIGPRIPDLYEITEEEMETYSKIALILFKPQRNTENFLEKFKI